MVRFGFHVSAFDIVPKGGRFFCRAAAPNYMFYEVERFMMAYFCKGFTL
jgi:hypothetical protein